MQKLVMVVDDSVTIRTIADFVFRKTEFDLLSVSSAAEALARLAEIKPEMIVLDAEMPSVDGYALAKRLRENEDTAEINLLLMVTDAGPDAERLGDTDIDGYVVKPFSSAELLDPIRMLTGVEVRHDVPLSFEQIMAARRAADEQRRAELEALGAEKKKSDEDELNFEMEEDGMMQPIRSRSAQQPPPPAPVVPPSPVVPPPPSISSQNAAEDLDLPRPPPPPPPSPLSARHMDIELTIEAPVSSTSNLPLDPYVPPPAPLRPPVGGPIGDPEPVEEPEQHVTYQAVEQSPAPRDTLPPRSEIRRRELADILVEHVADPVREPETRRTPPQIELPVAIPPQPRPRPWGTLFVGLFIIVVLLIVWLRY